MANGSLPDRQLRNGSTVANPGRSLPHRQLRKRSRAGVGIGGPAFTAGQAAQKMMQCNAVHSPFTAA